MASLRFLGRIALAIGAFVALVFILLRMFPHKWSDPIICVLYGVLAIYILRALWMRK